jgi:hypothetical protein
LPLAQAAARQLHGEWFERSDLDAGLVARGTRSVSGPFDARAVEVAVPAPARQPHVDRAVRRLDVELAAAAVDADRPFEARASRCRLTSSSEIGPLERARSTCPRTVTADRPFASRVDRGRRQER